MRLMYLLKRKPFESFQIGDKSVSKAAFPPLAQHSLHRAVVGWTQTSH